MKQKIAYIYSPARSGSTFLQFLLSNHPDMIGLGELYRVVQDINHKSEEIWDGIDCSCGSVAADCDFWSELVRRADSAPPITAGDVVGRFAQKFPDKVLIDSSKNGDEIDRYLANDQVELKMIILVRDYRGWVLSALKYNRLRREKSSGTGNSLSFTYNRVIMSYRWLYSTAKRMMVARRKNIDVLHVYYENLVFDTEKQTQRINEFLGIDATEMRLDVKPENSHELYGNSSLRSDSRKSSSIVYDMTWLTDGRLAFYSVVLFPVSVFCSWLAQSTRA